MMSCDGGTVARSLSADTHWRRPTRSSPGSRATCGWSQLDAARLLHERFAKPLILGATLSVRIPDALSRLGIAGGAVYDALVALAAVEHDADLATRDLRAKGTYEAVGARVIVAG